VDAETVRVDVPGTLILVGFSVAVSLGTPFNTSPTVPLNPRILEVLMVDVQEEPLPATTAMK
jgi:hypothetical protein